MGHKFLAPSAAHIWGKPGGCTMYPQVAAAFPDTPSPEAEEGEASHEIGAELIDAGTRAQFPDWKAFEGRVASNGVPFTHDMYVGAKLYADNVINVMRDHGVFGGEGLRVEQYVDIPRVHTDQNGGTPDCSLWAKQQGFLYVWDYKFGFGVVEAFENWQMMDYVAGLLDLHDINGHADQYTHVVLRVVQPRAPHRKGPIREWTVLASDLRSYINQMANNAGEATGPGATARTGSHCKHCPGRHACEPAIRAGVSMFEASATALPMQPSPAAMGAYKSYLDRAYEHIKSLREGFTTQMVAAIKRGEVVPGWTTEPTYGRQTWARPDAEVIMLGQMLGKDLAKPPQAITPNQARNLGIDPALIKQYSTQGQTGFKLVPDDGQQAKEAFSNE